MFAFNSIIRTAWLQFILLSARFSKQKKGLHIFRQLLLIKSLNYGKLDRKTCFKQKKL